MKKEDITSMLVYIIMLAIALVYGLTVLRNYAGLSGLSTGAYFGFTALAIVAGIIFNAFSFEMGHVIGAKVGGYEILSVNVLYFCLYKREGKWKFKFSKYDGLTGETRLAPRKDLGKEANPRPYCLLPIFLYILEMAAIIVAFIMLNNASLNDKTAFVVKLAYFLLTMGMVGLMIFVYDVFPARIDTTNDGYRLRLASNPKNKEAFNELLRVKNAIDNGETDVEIKTFETITNFTAELNFNKVYILLDQDKFEEAEVLVDSVLESKDAISNRTYLRAKAQKIYIKIMSSSLEEAQKYYEAEVPLDERKAISLDVTMESIRAYMLMSGLLDKSASETELVLKKVMKAFKRASKERQPVEIKLYNNALKRVIEAHPNWNLDGYLLESK